MSAMVFPSNLAGQIQEVWTGTYATKVLESVSGKEARASWRASARRRFKVKFDFLRDDVHCPAPNAAYHELELVQLFLSTHRGAWDSFSITDPISGATGVTVRLVEDSISFTKIVDHVWSADFEVVEVL
jgi:hypothetical protein